MILHMHSVHIHTYLLVEFQSLVCIHYKVMDVFALLPGSPSYMHPNTYRGIIIRYSRTKDFFLNLTADVYLEGKYHVTRNLDKTWNQRRDQQCEPLAGARFTDTYFYSKSVEQGISIAGARIVDLMSAEKNATFTTWLKDINTAKLTPNDLKS